MVNIAQYGLVLILSVLLVFHFLILLKIVPYNIIWGGRLKSNKEMYRFETVSICKHPTNPVLPTFGIGGTFAKKTKSDAIRQRTNRSVANRMGAIGSEHQ